MKKSLLILLTCIPFLGFTQNFTSYFTGNTNDVVVNPLGGICLMGGATEDDQAMTWFLQRANGGDVLVLRTSGSNGYNSYLYSGLGVPVNSVETIVCHNANASNEAYILQKIQQAEAIWFAGGDQWNYISYWRNTPMNSALNTAIQQKHIVIGGTSAGMAIMGKYYFSTQNGTVTSATALNNPFDNAVTVDSAGFLANNFLEETITDTHFDNPDRKGRLTTFLARIKTDYGVFAKAIACDEYTAVCIDTNGIAKVFGGFPNYDDNAYFIQSNCQLANQTPESCSNGMPLTWNLGGQAIKVYQIKGDSLGSKTFNLNTWQNGTGGSWFNWFVVNGTFTEQQSTAINCSPLGISEYNTTPEIHCYPNPTTQTLHLSFADKLQTGFQLTLVNQVGQIFQPHFTISGDELLVDMRSLKQGLYVLVVQTSKGDVLREKVTKL